MLTVVILASLLAGYQIDTRLATRRQRALADDLTQSVQHVLAVALVNRDRMERLAGLPCTAIFAGLHPTDYITPYLRQITFIQNDVRYCSTVPGIDSGALPAPPIRADAALTGEMRLSNDSLVTPGVPLMQFYQRLEHRTGVLYVIEGTYIIDLLARAKASGASSASLSARGGGTIDSSGVWHDSAAWPVDGPLFRVSLSADPVVRRRALLATESMAMVISLLLFSIVWMGYLAGFTPQQRLRRQVANGLRRGEFFLVYQAVMDMTSGQWSGAEALLRWNHPRLGLVAPDRFIREVERTTMIRPLTCFVLETAMSEMGACRLPPGFHISLNVSPSHIALPGFVGDILQAKAYGERHAVSEPGLILEVTERGLLPRSAAVQNGMHQLQSAGIQFAIDDFGIENSNLTLLQGFAFDYIKIDKSFVDAVPGSGLPLIEGILLLARKLNADVLAEGVETREQHDILCAAGVHYGQGFFYARPVSIAHFERDLAAATLQSAPLMVQQRFNY